MRARIYKPDAKRSRRLRKKLRLGEFQELGFSCPVTLVETLSEEANDAFLDRFLAEAIEANNLAFGGGWDYNYIVRWEYRESVSEELRQKVIDWLCAQPEIKDVHPSPLTDAWHGHDE
ncbi:hypothetical protein CO611_06900 [Lysobacteraceae bacterium NML03-0222]|nr:hypothetical protein CO611_06900 [Xanthomonadaceae bacterium NML03-0222]